MHLIIFGIFLFTKYVRIDSTDPDLFDLHTMSKIRVVGSLGWERCYNPLLNECENKSIRNDIKMKKKTTIRTFEPPGPSKLGICIQV